MFRQCQELRLFFSGKTSKSCVKSLDSGRRVNNWDWDKLFGSINFFNIAVNHLKIYFHWDVIDIKVYIFHVHNFMSLHINGHKTSVWCMPYTFLPYSKMHSCCLIIILGRTLNWDLPFSDFFGGVIVHAYNLSICEAETGGSEI